MTELVKQLADQVEGHGIWALLTTICSVIIATLVSKQLDAKWKHAYDREIETFKASMEQDKVVVNSALSSLNSASSASNELVLKSIEKVWDAMLKLNGAFPGVTLFADVLPKEEWCKFPSNTKAKIGMTVPSEDSVLQFIEKQLSPAEQARPFVGETIWSMYFLYRAIIMRVVAIVQMNHHTGKLPWWFDDQGIQQFLPLLFTKAEIQSIEKSGISMFQQIRGLAESKILLEMNKIVSGHRSAESGLDHAMKLIQAAASVDKHPRIVIK